MSDFEKYIEAKYPNRSPKILFQKFEDIDGTLFYGVKEIEDQAEVWNYLQAIIDNLKAQLECCRKENTVLQEVMLRDSALATKAQLERNELQGQMENIEACYIEKKKQVEVVSHMLEEDLKYVEQDRRGNFDFLQMAMIRCLGDAIKTLRGES
jgi:predicted nuclease with TOPRIM domain